MSDDLGPSRRSAVRDISTHGDLLSTIRLLRSTNPEIEGRAHLSFATTATVEAAVRPYLPAIERATNTIITITVYGAI